MTWRLPDICHFFRPHSLRQRYLCVAVALCLVVVTSAILTERYVSATSRSSAQNIDTRNQIQQRTRIIRNAVWGAEYALQSYILAPASWYHDAVLANFEDASREVTELQSEIWIQDNQLSSTADELLANLKTLQRQSDELMSIRVDVERLFPSAHLMDNVLSPTNANFQTAVRLALDEIATEEDPSRSVTYQAFEDARHAWSQMISAFRLYVVRRAGIYSDTEQGLRDASHDVTLLSELTEQHLHTLTLLDRKGKLGLQASDSLRQLKEYTGTWSKAFEEFRVLQETEHWRSDVPLIQNAVQPLFASIWNQLDQIDKQLEMNAEQDVSLWSEVGQRLNVNLLLLSALALFAIAVGFVFFQRTVLTPLSQLTSAMKAVAKGEGHARLPNVNSIEARDLVEAFAHMRRNVHERQIELRHQTLHDALTGLPNRVLLKDRLQQAILGGEREINANFCLLMIDLDRFKEINDTLGHQAGDLVLCEIGKRLTKLLRKSDTVARLGGDEFAILLPETRLRQAQEIAQVIAESIEQPILYNERDLLLGASIGLALYPEHGRDVDTLLKRADVAMYVAKQNGLDYSVYSVQQDQHSVGRLALISELRTAIAENELTLHYQPKMDFQTGRISGVEALLRWPQWSAVPTEYLIKTAEKTGLIKPLTQWVLNHALAQMSTWRKNGIHIPVAVNLSTWNLAHSDIDVIIDDLLVQHGVPPEMLELEITENSMMKNPTQAMSILDRLHTLGVKLTVDDYGTGFSSLAYLKTMPVDQVKIDKSFVIDMLEDENDAVIVRSTIDLAHNLGMKVVAEGVSNSEIWDLLEILRCDTAQGYFIAHPMSAAALEHWLDSDMRAEVGQRGQRA